MTTDTASNVESASGPPAGPRSVGEALWRHRTADRVAMRFEDDQWTWPEYVGRSLGLARWAGAQVTADRPHLALCMQNAPVFAFALGAAALGGPALVGLNLTRRGEELRRDLTHTDCGIVIADEPGAELLAGLGLEADGIRVVTVDEALGEAGPPADLDGDGPFAVAEDLFMLIFTSGSTGAPKAVRCSHGKVARTGALLAEWYDMSPADTAYIAMPMFHSNAVLNAWAPAMTGGAAIAIRRRFSASGFLPDVRRHGATYATYVGKPLNYILQTPARPDDHDNPLRMVSGNEATTADIATFSERFGCRVFDAFGSTEGGVAVRRSDDTPPGSIGRLGDGVAILTDDGEAVATAELAPDGTLLNPETAIGQLVNTAGAGSFEGYYDNDEANEERLRGGMYWSGDLAYADANGDVYFAGRTAEWVRVDGENIGLALVDRALATYAPARLVAAYGVRREIGDAIAVALLLRDGATFEPDAFADYLRGHEDLSPKWWPSFVDLRPEIPLTPTNKILRRELAADAFAGTTTLYAWDAPADRYVETEEVRP